MLDLLSQGLVIATHNDGKLREFKRLLDAFPFKIIGARQIGLSEPVEDGADFDANARIKAHAAAQESGLPALADDSGYSVDALGGAPGLYSARWAGPERDFTIAMQRVEHELRQKEALTPDQRRCRFICVLCLALPSKADWLFRGEISGQSIWPPRGNKGFGYDPIFRADGFTRSFGEITNEEKLFGLSGKGGFSHRARAFEKLKTALLSDNA